MSLLIFPKRQISFSVLFVSLVASLFTASAQSNAQSNIFSEKFKAYADYYFQEKVYIHHDKDSYIAGETMWLKAYRVDASTHLPFLFSRVIYVELRNPENKVARRMIMMQVDSCFKANYAIPIDWPSGYYELVAYTNYMQNFDEDFYFRKKIYIYNSNDNVVDVDITYDPVPKQKLLAVDALIFSNNGHLFKNKILEIETYSKGNLVERFFRSTDKDGRFKFNLKDVNAITSFSLAFENREPVGYKRLFKVPIFSDSIDVQFMPEGGHLLAGVPQRIAFKAVGADGKSVELKGTVSDNYGNKIADIATTHCGMGQFTMSAMAGARHTANLVAADGRWVEVELPLAVNEGLTLSTSLIGNMLICQVLATPLYKLDDMFVGIHTRGRVLYWQKLTSALQVEIPLASVPDGIVHCFVADEQGRMYSERLMLVNRDTSPDVKISGLRQDYGRRQLVDLELDLKVGNVALPSDLSVSVVDTKLTTVDKSDNIVSNLLLSSDIKGSVENAAYYFDKSVPAADRARDADLLMMTQAWRRIGGVIRGKKPTLDYALQLGQSISGKITRTFGGKAKEGKLMLVGTYNGKNKNSKVVFARQIEADEEGDFIFESIAFPDKTIFLISGLQKENRKNVAITIDSQRFREIPFKSWGRPVQLKKTAVQMSEPEATSALDAAENYYKNAGFTYYYVNGIKVVALGEVEVVRYKRNSDWGQVQLNEDSKYSTTLDEMLENRHYSVRDWLRSIPEIEIRNYDDPTDQPGGSRRNTQSSAIVPHGYESIYYKGRRVRVNAQYHDDILDMPLSAVNKIWIDTRYESNGIVKLVAFTKYRYGVDAVRYDKLSMFEFVQIGYSVPDKFYEPKYDGSESNQGVDERSTVHWDPHVVVGADGKAKVSFYTTDMLTKYRMVIQGVGINGMPIYKEVEFTNGGNRE